MANAKETSKAKRILNRIGATLSIIIFVFAVVVFAVVIIARISGQAPTIFGYTFNLVITDSMEPEILVDDLVIAKVVDESQIVVGDDIVFASVDPRLQGTQFVHRVVAINEDGSFVTSGIKEGATVDPYAVKEIIGKKVSVSTTLGHIMKFFNQNQYVVLGAIVVLIMVIVVAEIVKMYFASQKNGDNGIDSKGDGGEKQQ